METFDHPQGSPAWHAHRASHFNASDAPAMLGLSPYKTRSQLLREMATGITPAIDPATQRRFDDGHRFEGLARPLAEALLGEALPPAVGHEGKLSASFDGLTKDGSICWEHKTLNDAYRNAVQSGGMLPPALLAQIEQQLMIAGSDRCLFTATRWDGEECVERVHRFVKSDPELRKALLQGWKQFAIDLEAYVHVEQTVAPTGRAPDSLPALLIEVTGMVTASNLTEFKQHAMTVFDGIKTALVTDADFADAEKTVKWCKEVEDRLDAAKSHALAQTASIDELFRVIDQIKEESRSKRLALDKLVKAEKENRRAEIVTNALTEITGHIRKLNERIGGQWVQPITSLRFTEAVKGLKSIDSMRDKVATALANAKIEANEIADRIELNRNSLLIGTENDTSHLFPDFAQVCTKLREDFAALHAMRMQQEAVRKEDERKAAEAREAAAVAAAVEAERQAGEKRAADEAERIRKEADKAGEPQNFAATIFKAGTENPLGGLSEAAITPPIQQSDAAMITEFLALQSCSPAAKKEMRATIEKWETYRIKVSSINQQHRKADGAFQAGRYGA